MLEFGLQVSNLEIHRYRDVAQEAEGLGYHLITVPDHLVHEQPGGQYDPFHLAHEAMVVAAVLCEATQRIRVGHLVLCNPFRHPAITAQALVSLDHLSGGRLIGGFGTGWTATEFRMTGIPFPPIDARLRMLDEALSAIRSLWTSEETTLEGEFYRLRGAILWPKPVQKPHPPILLGGGGKGLLRLAAKHADIVNLIADVGRPGRITLEELQRLTDESFRAKVAFVREEARRLGRDPGAIRVSNGIFTVVLADSSRAARETAEGLAPVFGVSPEAVLRSPLALIGTPEQCIEELRRRVREWGVTQFVFSGGAERWMRHLMEDVLAHV
jgi:probable F420-dependent oxidoreductase